MNRRAFVGLGAGAAFAGTIAAALAAGEGFGAPHPPIVAEDDGALEVTRPALQSGGRTVAAYAARPRGTVKGRLVVVQAIWGVDAQLRDVVRRFAKEGYVAIAPDLYAGLGAPSGDGDERLSNRSRGRGEARRRDGRCRPARRRIVGGERDAARRRPEPPQGWRYRLLHGRRHHAAPGCRQCRRLRGGGDVVRQSPLLDQCEQQRPDHAASRSPTPTTCARRCSAISAAATRRFSRPTSGRSATG